jgi:hypothetical protein
MKSFDSPREWSEWQKGLREELRAMNKSEVMEIRRLVDHELSGRAEPSQSSVEEYVPYRDGYLQLEYRTNPKTGTQRGPYWYFRFHDNGKQRTLYIGSVDEEEAKRRVDQKRGS